MFCDFLGMLIGTCSKNQTVVHLIVAVPPGEQIKKLLIIEGNFQIFHFRPEGIRDLDAIV